MSGANLFFKQPLTFHEPRAKNDAKWSPLPTTKEWERGRERGIFVMFGLAYVAWRHAEHVKKPPLPSPLLQRRRGRSRAHKVHGPNACAKAEEAINMAPLRGWTASFTH
jgi:hypothetical protein